MAAITDPTIITPTQQAQTQRGIEAFAGPMPKPVLSGRVPDDREYGASGTPIISGILQTDEYNPELSWKQALRTWNQMLRSDAVVQLSSFVREFPIRAATKKIAPASPDPRHIEQASLIESALFHQLQGQTFDDVLRQALTCCPMGFALFEKNFTQDEHGNWIWKNFAFRSQMTLNRWWQNADSSLYGIQQWTWDPAIQNYAFINIVADKLLRFTYRQVGDNYEGVSILRPAWPAWQQKQYFMKIQAVGFEREHVGVPVITLPEGYSQPDFVRAATIGRNLRGNEQAYVTLPFGWQIDWLKTKGSSNRGTGIGDAIRYMDLQILNSVLAGFLALGHSGAGSYAMSNDQSTLFLRTLQADANYIASVFHQDAFPQLLKANYGHDYDMAPTLVFQSIQAYSIAAVADAIAKLTTAGAMRPSVEIEDYLYELIGVPRPPGNLIESTYDGKDDRSRLKPDQTGVTPLPLTPQEEIAVGNRVARDVERASVQKAPQPGQPSPAQSMTPSAQNTPDAGTASRAQQQAAKLNEVYSDHLARPMRRMSFDQQQRYIRMAEEAGRPTIQLRGDYEFASWYDGPAAHKAHLLSEQPGAAQRKAMVIERMDRRREVAGSVVDEVERQVSALWQDLRAEVEQDTEARIDAALAEVGE